MKMKEEWRGILPQLYQSASVQTLKEFIHRCADDILGRKPPQYESISSTGWSQEQFNDAVLQTKLFLVDAVSGNFDCESIEAKFSTLDKQLTTAISNCVNVRSNELKVSLLAMTATTPGISLLDFDWKLKWVIGSSSLAIEQEPLVSVNLHLATKTADCLFQDFMVNNAEKSTVSFELNSAELDSLVNSLANVEGSPL